MAVDRPLCRRMNSRRQKNRLQRQRDEKNDNALAGLIYLLSNRV